MIHQLKIRKRHLDEIGAGRKSLEFRKNDRNFQVGDILGLNEIDDTGNYTKRCALVVVCGVLTAETDSDYADCLKEGCVCLSIRPAGVCRVPWDDVIMDFGDDNEH